MSAAAYRRHAARATIAYVRSAGGAAVWPEIEYVLANTDWYTTSVEGAPVLRGIDPHHLSHARRGLIDGNVLIPDTATLNGMDVTAFLDARGLAARQKTAITRLAAAKRRQYRRYMSWTNESRLCGHVLERQVEATLKSLAGTELLLNPSSRGEVSTIEGRPVSGGPLDHAGALLLDPARQLAGMVGFVVEDKNVRSWLYPNAIEVFDLLVKAGEFPEHVPWLMTKRVHYTTLTLFKAIGALAYTSKRQYFAPAIDAHEFLAVKRDLRLGDIERLVYPDRPSSTMAEWCTTVMRKPSGEDPSVPNIKAYQRRWAVAAPICARFSELRSPLDPDTRTDIYQQLLEELDEAGLDVGRLRAQHRAATTEPEEVDAWDLIEEIDLR